MGKKTLPVVWEAAPHTLAKISILENYLSAWFPIFGRTRRGQTLLYIDGFAGPGYYTNSPKGSPIAALEAASKALDAAGSAWIAGEIHCVFMEPDPARYEHLVRSVEPFQDTGGLKIHTLPLTFAEGISRIQDHTLPIPRPIGPRFAFIDPFGATGVPFETVRTLLSNSSAEILLNLDADGVVRILKAQDAAGAVVHLSSLFGSASWSVGLDPNKDLHRLCLDALTLYKEELRSISGIKYVYSFEMRTTAASINYFLVFAASHPLGLEKMKESMKQMDQSGRYCFTDTRVGQQRLFREDDVRYFSNLLFERFCGKRARYDELAHFALNETPFPNPKSMLRELEGRSLIEVVSSDPKRRKSTFRPDKVVNIAFAECGHG